MSLIKFFNAFSNLFEDREPVDARAVDTLIASGHMVLEKNLSPRIMAALTECMHGSEVGRATLMNGRVVYYDRYASNAYQLPALSSFGETLWSTAFTPHRDLSEILASVSPAPTTPVSTQRRFTVVSS